MTRRTLAAAAALLAALLLLAVAGCGGSSQPPPVKLGGPGAKTIPAPASQTLAGAAAGLADHQGLRDETPPGLPHSVQVKRQDGLEGLQRFDQLPLVSPDAAPTISGCTSRFVRNYSSRGGVAPHELVAHYTVSHNIAGWGDVWSVVDLFDRAAYQASSNFVIDGEGHCAYIVRDTDKAWAQAAANPYSVSIEFVAYGNEGKLSPQQLKAGGHVFAIEAKKWGIPIQLGKVSNCLPTRYGIVDHAMLGVCGGGHHDLRPFYGSSAVPNAADDAKVLAPLIAATKAAAGGAQAAAIKPGGGNSSTAVKSLKARLRNAGCEKVSTDGTYGPTAQACVKAFKVEQGLPHDKVAGPGVLKALEHPNPTLKPRTRDGHAVKAAKYRLRQHGWKHVTSDGTYGPHAQHAVRVFKRHHGLPHDKVVGPSTWRALR